MPQRASFLALGLPALLLAACSGGDGSGPDGRASAPAAPRIRSTLALMLQMDGPWQLILRARSKGEADRVGRYAAELARLVDDPLLDAARPDEVWRQYVETMRAEVARLEEAAPEDLGEAVRRVEFTCNECHRRYQ